MKRTTIQIVLAACCFAFTSAHAMTKAEYKAEKDRIGAEYKAARENCKSMMTGNPKDVCIAEAKANRKKAKVAAEASYKNTPRARKDMVEDSADADYKVAKEKCDAMTGNQKDVGIKEAKAAKTKAMANLKAGSKSSEARTDAAKEKMDADYSVAKEKCDAYSGPAKDKCLADAKLKYGVR